MNPVTLTIYPVADVPAATKMFAELLGGDPYVDSPYYVGFKTGNMEIGLVPQAASPGMTGALTYVDVADINGMLATLNAAGAQTVQEPRDVAQGLLVASVKTVDGNAIGLRQFPK